jgi:hypothetical protein
MQQHEKNCLIQTVIVIFSPKKRQPKKTMPTQIAFQTSFGTHT